MTDQDAFTEAMTVRDMYRTTTTEEQWRLMILGLGHILTNEALSNRAETILRATLLETSMRFGLLKITKGAVVS